MKKFALCIALVFVLVMAVSSTSTAAGIKLVISGYCNDFWVNAASEASGVYSCHGYEYGCGYSDRMIDGVLRVAGGYGYFGLLGSYGQGSTTTYGMIKNENLVITLSAKTGSGSYLYVYNTGSHGGAGSYTMSYPVPPPAPAEAGALEPDSAAQ